MIKELLMDNAQKRIERIAADYGVKGSILNHLVEYMDAQDVYSVFKSDIGTIEGAEHIHLLVNRVLSEYVSLGVVKEAIGPDTYYYYLDHINDYCDSERIKEDDLMDILKAKSRISQYYEENKKIIERCNGEPLENSKYRLALKEYGRLHRLYDEILYKFMSSEDRLIYEESIAKSVARRERIIARLKEKGRG